MLDFIYSELIKLGITKDISVVLAKLIAFVIALFTAWFSSYLFRITVINGVRSVVKKTKTRWDDIFLKQKGFKYIVRIVPAVVLYLFLPLFPEFAFILGKILNFYLSVTVMIIMLKLIKSFDILYTELYTIKRKSIRGYIQILQLLTVLVGVIFIISDLLNKSPTILLSGIGAATAVLLLIFKDTILGLVAGIQINVNQMVQLEDWIQVPSYGADGEVIDINLTTVTVLNFDKTRTSIPITAIVSSSFKNYNNIYDLNVRRIKRSIFIDMNTVKNCTQEMMEKYKRIKYVSSYVNGKEIANKEYNNEKYSGEDPDLNGKKLTNLGVFRKYISLYLEDHSGINNNMLQLVRQLAPTDKGLPLEIYAFANTAAFVDYENIQADIFDHILAIIGEFDLRIYQVMSDNQILREEL